MRSKKEIASVTVYVWSRIKKDWKLIGCYALLADGRMLNPFRVYSDASCRKALNYSAEILSDFDSRGQEIPRFYYWEGKLGTDTGNYCAVAE